MRTALAGTEVDQQVSLSYEEIERRLLALRVLPEE
jgi:hypothetical protein